MIVHRNHALTAVTILLTLLAVYQGKGQSTLDDSLFSPSLGRIKHLIVILPEGYNRAEKYPAMLLLHGFTGNYRNWLELTRVAEYSRGLKLLLVLPDGENSWYVNQALKPAAEFENYIVHDVLGKVRRDFAVDTNRIAIGGLSMGGYGALALGLRHPDMFRFVAGLSASMDIPDGIQDLARRGREYLHPSLDTAFGGQVSDQWTRYDLFTLVEQLDSARAPYVYLANGEQDEFEGRLYLYRQFADALRRHHMAYEYHETPGRHNFEYWDREIRGVIFRLSELWQLSSAGTGGH